MTNYNHYKVGQQTCWARLVVTAIGATDIVVYYPPAAAGDATATYRAVITGWSAIGHNTNAAATVFTVRGKVTTTAIAFGGSMGPTNGSVGMGLTGIWTPMPANESLQLNVTGALTGQLDVYLEYIWLSAKTAAAGDGRYSGVP